MGVKKHFSTEGFNINFTDVWVFIVIFLFTLFVDVIYVLAHFIMGIQISDYWLVVNCIFYGIELLAITAVNIFKKLKPDQKETYKEVAAVVGKSVGAGVVSAISENITLPELTSGSIGKSQEERDEENNNDEDDKIDETDEITEDTQNEYTEEILLENMEETVG